MSSKEKRGACRRRNRRPGQPRTSGSSAPTATGCRYQRTGPPAPPGGSAPPRAPDGAHGRPASQRHPTSEISNATLGTGRTPPRTTIHADRQRGTVVGPRGMAHTAQRGRRPAHTRSRQHDVPTRPDDLRVNSEDGRQHPLFRRWISPSGTNSEPIPEPILPTAPQRGTGTHGELAEAAGMTGKEPTPPSRLLKPIRTNPTTASTLAPPAVSRGAPVATATNGGQGHIPGSTKPRGQSPARPPLAIVLPRRPAPAAAARL